LKIYDNHDFSYRKLSCGLVIFDQLARFGMKNGKPKNEETPILVALGFCFFGLSLHYGVGMVV